jgi:hypothetical protein
MLMCAQLVIAHSHDCYGSSSHLHTACSSFKINVIFFSHFLLHFSSNLAVSDLPITLKQCYPIHATCPDNLQSFNLVSLTVFEVQEM